MELYYEPIGLFSKEFWSDLENLGNLGDLEFKFGDRAIASKTTLTGIGTYGVENIKELIDAIEKIALDPIAGMFSGESFSMPPGVDVNKNSMGFKELEKYREKVLDSVEDYIVNNLSQALMAEKAAEEFKIAVGDTITDVIAKVAKGKKLVLENWYKNEGAVGTFLEDIFFKSGGDSPQSDFKHISTELKSKMGTAKSYDISIGNLTVDIVGNKLSQNLNKKEQDMLTSLVIIFKLLAKIRNLMVVMFRFDNPKTTYTKKGGWNIRQTSKQLVFEEILLYMVLKVYELWTAIYANVANFKWHELASSLKIVATPKFKKGKVVFSFTSGNLKLTGKSANRMPIHGNWQDLYMRRVDLLKNARGSSEAFRRKLFGFVRYNQDWADVTGFGDWNANPSNFGPLQQ